MCGICGIYDYGRGELPDESVLRSMLAALRHRGPDDEGVYLDGGLALGMRRLSIIDLEGGKQPIANEDGTVVVVCNGEIYNYRELAQDLVERGHHFATASDTEVIVHLYEERGDACVHDLRGMFGFAVWDAKRQRLLVARDRLGIKPLYYAQTPHSLVFGSEIKALLRHPGITASPDYQAVGDYLSLKYVPAPRTMFAGIASLPPGHLLTCDRSGVRVRSYWDLSFGVNGRSAQSDAAYAEELEALLDQTVSLHLRSDVPFGVFLSGGVDSSLVVALMRQRLKEPVKTFSVGFTGGRNQQDELPYARRVARQFEAEHHEVVLGPASLMELAEKVIWHLDQPIADQATLATLAVSQLASRHVKMVLTGEGGDELFAGYARYSGERLAPFFRLLPGPMRSLAQAAGAQLPGLRRFKIALHALCQPDEVSRFVNWFPLFNGDMKRELLTESAKSALNGHSTERVFAEHLARTSAGHALHRMLYVDTKLWLPDFLLLRGDKLSMACSLEARVPLLDHTLVEFAASLPPHLKLRGLKRKYLLKKVSRRYLPPEIVDRKKQGFPIPISSWLRHDARSYMRELLSPEVIRRRGLLEARHVSRLLAEHESGFADHGTLLWGLMNLELWHRMFIDSSPERNTVRRTSERRPVRAGKAG
jgi:asparagine synthase (glutamine-hydrolysing)